MTQSSPLHVGVPVIETKRLTLRAHRRDDFSACVAMWADPLITRGIGGNAFSPAQTWSKMLRYLGMWSLLGFGYWALEEKATQNFVGELGFADFKRDMQPSLDGLPELGWVVVSAAQRKGYATEAVHAALEWADGHLGDRPTVCIVGPDNVASLRVAEQAGYREFTRTSYDGAPVIVFRRLRCPASRADIARQRGYGGIATPSVWAPCAAGDDE